MRFCCAIILPLPELGRGSGLSAVVKAAVQLPLVVVADLPAANVSAVQLEQQPGAVERLVLWARVRFLTRLVLGVQPA